MKTFVGKLVRGLTLLVITLVCSTAVAEIRSDVDRRTISMGESLRLTVTGDASERLDQLDLAVLQFDWEILSTSSSTNTSFINGARSTTRTLTLDLLSVRDGILSIPSLSTGGNRTTPIAITVNPQVVSAGGDDSVRFDIDIDKRDVYIQEQLILTVTIEQAINLDGAEVTQLAIDGAIVEELTRRNFQRQINGRLWRVTQLRYAIYPQQRGMLEIPSLSLTAREVLPGRSLLGARLGKRFKLSKDAIQVNVKPVPENFPGDVWLPAVSLELRQSWSKAPDSMEVGDSTTRTLTLAGEGLLSSQLPSMTSMSDNSQSAGIRVYPDQESSDQIERTDGFWVNEPAVRRWLPLAVARGRCLKSASPGGILRPTHCKLRHYPRPRSLSAHRSSKHPARWMTLRSRPSPARRLIGSLHWPLSGGWWRRCF